MRHEISSSQQQEPIFTLKISYPEASKGNEHIVYVVSDYIQLTHVSGNRSVIFYRLGASWGVTYASEYGQFATLPSAPVNRAERSIFCRSEAFSGPQTSKSRLRCQFTCLGCRKVYILVPFLLGAHYFGPTWQAQWQVVIRLEPYYSTILAAIHSLCALKMAIKWYLIIYMFI